MVKEQEDVFYYITVMNENYEHPEMPEGAADNIIKGMYQFRKGTASNGPRVQLLGSGTIFREVIAAAELLRNDWGVESDLWGCSSFNELARDLDKTRRAGTCCIHSKPIRNAFRTSRRNLPQGHARSGHRRHRLRAPLRRTD